MLIAARLVVTRRGLRGPGGGEHTPAVQALAAQTLDGLLTDSLAAVFGLYRLPERDRLHDTSGRPAIEILFLTLPEGLLLVDSQRGLDRALHFGLYERIHQTFIAAQTPGAG